MSLYTRRKFYQNETRSFVLIPDYTVRQFTQRCISFAKQQHEQPVASDEYDCVRVRRCRSYYAILAGVFAAAVADGYFKIASFQRDQRADTALLW